MNLKLFNKDKMGYMSTLLLIVLLSQSTIFNYLVNTILGRGLLILFILFISYTNKMIGLVAILFTIIMISISGFNYKEGLPNVRIPPFNQPNVSIPSQPNVSILPVLPDFLSSKSNTSVPDGDKSSKKSFEGFDIIGTESNILRGKQSKCISANNVGSTNVSPYDETVGYANF